MVDLSCIQENWRVFQKWSQEEGYYRMAQHAVLVILFLYLIRKVAQIGIKSRGKTGLIQNITKMGVRLSRKLPFVNSKIEKQLETEATKNTDEMLKDKKIVCEFETIPKKGLSHDQIKNILDTRIAADVNPRAGKTFAYVYDHSEEHSKITQQCFVKYMHSNALNPVVFNSLRVIENEVVKMCINMFNGDDKCVGNMTSCGTESLLLTMKTYRDYRGYGDVIMSTAGHPGINKGCGYVGLNIVEVPIDENRKMSIPHLKKVISSRTVLVVCSAPQYPHGVVDDVEQIGKVCEKYGVPLHVDSAIGGFVLPWIQKLGKNKFGKWDFRVPAVTSINADIHKYGYSPKGSSVLVYRNSKIRRNQFFTFATWPGGIYISPTALGSRNGGCLSSAWASFLDLGEEGFIESTKKILESVEKLCSFIKNNDELELMAEPHSTIVSFRCKNINTYSFGDSLKKYGYAVQMQSNPQCVHMSMMPQHCKLIDDIMSAMQKAIKQIQANPSLYENDSKAVYGMLAKIPDEAVVEDFMVHYMDQIYKYKKK